MIAGFDSFSFPLSLAFSFDSAPTKLKPAKAAYIRPETLAAELESASRRVTPAPSPVGTDPPSAIPTPPNQELVTGKAVYTRPTSASATPVEAKKPAPLVAKSRKPPGVLPLSAEEKASRLPTKLAAAFDDLTLEVASSSRIYAPAPRTTAVPVEAKAPTEAVTHGFWAAPPSLSSGKAVFPLPKNVPEVEPEDASRPRVDIFVDNSNILYSFLNWVRARPDAKVVNIQTVGAGGKTRVVKTVSMGGRKVRMDYATLFAILERGRKVEKRVLVGSSPMWQSLEPALEWSYEVSILQRVPRSDTTGGKKRNAKRGKSKTSGVEKVVTQVSGAGSSDSMLQPAVPEKEVGKVYKEQGVDELLHLKILESLLDHTPSPSSPAPLLVLATGDAKNSEYNPTGFLGCVRRALERGWDVEIIAFPDGTSSSWLGEQAREELEEGGERHRGKLKVVDLARFAEELVA
ncbi:hypothetical protein MNV49_007130 [Pseudohyphozyma bogoriensis]|nr:hypothetical protein MNV49_007130 [Pseudohyphozyma bogoriensis]